MREGRGFRVLSHVRGSLWFVPVLCVGAGVALSFATLWIDGQAGHTLIPQSLTGGPDASLSILSAVATSMVSLAALVLTITMVVVQLAMGQFSPRIVQPILKDRPSQSRSESSSARSRSRCWRCEPSSSAGPAASPRFPG